MEIKKLICLVVIVFCSTAPLLVLAQDPERQLVPTEGYEDGSYTLESFETMAIFIGKAILGLSGAIALAMFVWGGIQMVIAAGKAETFKKGRETVINSLIGLAIIFCSYLIIDFVLKTIGVNDWTRVKIDQVMNIQRR